MTRSQTLETIQAALAAHPEFVCGSLVRGEACGKPAFDGDVDRAVSAAVPLTAETHTALIEALARVTGRPIAMQALRRERADDDFECFARRSMCVLET